MKIIAYTDGSCGGNPGPMGWAALAIMRAEDNEWMAENKGETQLFARLIANHDPDPKGTNNRAELMGVIEALGILKEFYRKDSTITIHTDSSWVKNSLDGTYKKVKKNLDLLSKAAGLMAQYEVCALRHVKGHDGDSYNEIVDNYAVAARTDQKRISIKHPYIVGLRP